MYDLKVIKVKIIESGKSQKELAKEIGITEVTLSKWINGQIGNISKFIELCKILDINIDDIKKDS